MIEVTQEDRRAFHALRSIECSNEAFWAHNEGAAILSGALDNIPQIQAFARHRIAAEQRARIEGYNEGIEAAANAARVLL